MKYIIILGDGMADLPIEKLNNKTPLMVAKKPNMDNLVATGEIGLCKTVPGNFKPGSDVANLSVLGYDPNRFYSGRSSLEAVSIGATMDMDDVALRVNLVTLSNEIIYEEKTMIDYSSGEILTEEASILIDALKNEFKKPACKLYPGFSYRHCLIIKNSKTGAILTPPHDITGKTIKQYLPQGVNSEMYLEFMKRSYEVLKNHPVNIGRQSRGLNPANAVWLWGEGRKPRLIPFEEKTGLKGAIISAVDLLKGIGMSAGMQICEVEGATGTLNTNYNGKAMACINAIKNNDFVYLHVEAPDECGHHGDLEGKIKAIENIDSLIVGPIKDYLDILSLPYVLMVLPDHPTPIETKTHTSDAVPYVIYRSYDIKENSLDKYDEDNAKQGGNYVENGYTLIDRLIGGNNEK